MTVHYCAKEAVISNQPGVMCPALSCRAALYGLTMACKYIGPRGALYIVVGLIVQSLLTLSTWLKIWENILISLFRGTHLPVVSGSNREGSARHCLLFPELSL